MIKENKNANNESFEALPIPEEAVILEDKKITDLSQISLLAIKKLTKERGIDLKIKKKRNNSDLDCIFEINNFFVQVVFTGINSDQIEVPLNRWYKLNESPQIILAASIDEENNIVFFNGIITAKEFINIFLERNAKNKSFQISLKEFKGGINRLLSFVQILDSQALSKEGIRRNKDFLESLLKKSVLSRKNISIALAAAGVIIFGPSIFRPRMLANVASIPISQIEITGYKRGIDNQKKFNLCLFSPKIINDNSNSPKTVYTSINQPLIFSPDPLNEISISKNGKILWSKNSTFDKKIKGPISWPITPINPNEEYLLTIRPLGTVLGESAKFILKGSQGSSLINLENLIDQLGDNKSAWNKFINKELKNDINIALSLLFSDEAPESRMIKKARRLIAEREGCL